MVNKKYATHRREPFFEIAQGYIKTESKVLDIGAGSGLFSKYCNRTDFYLFDGNAKTITELKKENKNVVQGQLPSLPFEDNFFDLIHCSHVIEHLTPDMFYETLKEMDRCLKVGGYLIISAPLLWSGFYNDLSHVRPYNSKVFRNYLCGEQIFSRTRNVISQNYQQIRLIDRYNETEENFHFTYKKSNILSKIAGKIIYQLMKMNFIFFEKTGFTIILKKR
jgi:ubiquinone/menaquinone biosynthesis C-methylase UbiE